VTLIGWALLFFTSIGMSVSSEGGDVLLPIGEQFGGDGEIRPATSVDGVGL
jgi:hypothetical protein